MLVVQNATSKSEKSSTKREQELRPHVSKTRPKSTKMKTSDSSNITTVKKLNKKKLRSDIKTSKKTITNHSTKLSSHLALYNNIKAKVKMSESLRTNKPDTSKAKIKKRTSLMHLEINKFKKDLSSISKIKKSISKQDESFFLPNAFTKIKSKHISNSKLLSTKIKSLSSHVPITKNETKSRKHSKNGTKSIKHIPHHKNDSEKSINKDNASVRDNSKLKSSVKSSYTLDGRRLPKILRKNVIGLTGPKVFRTKIKSLRSDTKPKVDDTHDRSKTELFTSNKISSSFRKKITDGTSFTSQTMQRKINSLELMNKVYPRIEVTSASIAKYPVNSKTKSDLIPRKLNSDNKNQLRLKSKTFFEFKKSSSAPEPVRRISRIQRLSSTVPSNRQSTKSLNEGKASVNAAPKWQVQRLGISAKEPENDLLSLKAIVDSAKMQHKTFTCCGGYRSIRSALESRGWIERINIYQTGYDDLTRQLYKLSVNDLMHGINDRNTGIAHRRVILSKLMGSHQVDLYWDYSNDVYHGNPDSVKLTMINSIQRGVFSYATKHGLCESSKDAHWYHKPGKCHLRYPRSYSVTSTTKAEEFVKDFKVTACMSLLKWISEIPRTKFTKLTSDQGKISIEHFKFAVKECTKFIRKLKHEDIDRTIPESSDKDWTNFMEAYSEAVHRGNHFKTNIYETDSTIIHKSNVLLDKLKKYWPYCEMDGYMNIWILKPSYGSRGIGIHICRTLAYVLRIVAENKNHTYVIQKYIERPLLIFNTKFDIRQWFLISSTSPLTIWMYKECYLRFSSQTYNLRKLHESIHLTNNSVQSRYHNTANRDPSIPNYNMWDLQMFKQHLVNTGYAGVFESIIYPGMKECITAAILMNQDHLNKRKNSFQLHGADFMLTEDFKPWLIEINARPALYSSTPITARMCPKVLTDTIRVMIDLKENRNAETGLFDLLYKEEVEKLPKTIFDPNQFVIQGHAIRKDYFQTPQQAIVEGNLCNSKKSSEIIDITNNKNFILQVGKEMRSTLEQLLSLIHKEKNRRKLLKTQLSSSSTLKMKKKELTELYKKEDFDEVDSQQLTSSMELKNVLYNTLSNNVLNSISVDAKQLHGMISKELGMPPTIPIPSAHNIDGTTPDMETSKSSQCILTNTNTLSDNVNNEYTADTESVECHKEMSITKPSGSIFDNLLGMFTSLSFS